MNDVTPPGWYPDPDGQMRWWDGNAWTENVQTEGQTPGRAFGAAPTQGGPDRKKLYLGIGAGVAVLAVVGVVLALVLGGGGDGGPEDVATKYVTAASETDADELCALTYFETDEQRDGCVEMYSASDSGPEVDLESVDVKSAQEDGNEATVKLEVTATVDGEKETRETTLTLTKVDGEWFVNGFDD